MDLETPGKSKHEYYHPPDKTMEHFRRHAHLSISSEELEKLCEGDKTLKSLFDTMMGYCKRYAEDVETMTQFYVTSVGQGNQDWQSELKKMDAARTILHDATIDSINILSRNLKEHGRSNEWLRPIATDPDNRGAYARFAIGLAFSYYLSLREKEKDYEENH